MCFILAHSNVSKQMRGFITISYNLKFGLVCVFDGLFIYCAGTTMDSSNLEHSFEQEKTSNTCRRKVEVV
jgi:hypothetical protein